MKERPILFSAPMVRALLSGVKTQTRRVVKPQPKPQHHIAWVGKEGPFPDGFEVLTNYANTVSRIRCPYGVRGAKLWVRETWRTEELTAGAAEQLELAEGTDGVRYEADDGFQVIESSPEASESWVYQHNATSADRGRKWRPSIHMPRWASRITLEVTGVRVERLQAISFADAVAEGVEAHDDDGVTYYGPLNDGHADPRHAYRELWECINGPESWKANPWVWVLEFRRVNV